MGIVEKTIRVCTCDLCGAPCDENDGAISVRTDGGDRDVGPGRIHGKLKYTKPYACTDGVVCKACKLKWLRAYVLILEQEQHHDNQD